MKYRILALLIVLSVNIPVNAAAEFNDAWYLGYMMRGSALVEYQGPYDSEVTCQDSRLAIPFGATFLGCYRYHAPG